METKLKLIPILFLIAFSFADAQITVPDPTFIKSYSPTWGAWVQDPLQTNGAGKIWVIPGYGYGNHNGYINYGYSGSYNVIYEYSSMADLLSNTISQTYTLPFSISGTGHVIYDGNLYFNKYGTNNMVKYNLASQTVLLDIPLPGAGYMNTYHYGWGGFSDIDFEVDGSGLWVMYSNAANAGKLVVSKLDPSTLGITATWNTNSEPKTQMGNAFIIDGVVYCIDLWNSVSQTINYTYNTNTSIGGAASIPWTNGSEYLTSCTYNPNTGKLYSWNNGGLYTYNLAPDITLPPTITSVSPQSGSVGSSVTITGTNFSTTAADNIVYFGATKATVTAATTTQLVVTVPVGATYEPISVTANELTAFSTKPFDVTFISSGDFDVTSFAPRVNLAAGIQPYGVVSADLDLDGKPDLAIPNTNSANTISVLRNNATVGLINNSSLNPNITFSSGNNVNKVALADIDGDGKKDMIETNYGDNTFSVFRNTSKPGSLTSSSFASRVNFTTGPFPQGISVNDIDMDGKLDVVVVNSQSPFSISAFRNTSTSGNISFEPKVDFALNGQSFYVKLRDIDGDGKPDMVAVVTSSSTLTIFRNTSTPGIVNSSSFASPVSRSTGGTPRDFDIADMDDDDKLDLIIPNQNNSNFYVLRNLSSPGAISLASANTVFSSIANPISARAGDIDGDGKPDLVIVGSNTAQVFKNNSVNGSFSFGPGISFALGNAAMWSAIVDIDGDSKPEICANNFNDNTISILHNVIPTKQNQTIAFSDLQAKNYGDADFVLTATASSGLPVDFTSSDPTVASINGSTVTILKAGSTIITASQGGDANWYAAQALQDTLVVNKAVQTITFEALVYKTYGDVPFELTGVSSSDLPVGYISSDTTVAKVNGHTLTILNAGSTTITASQGGNENFLAAEDAQQTLTVNKASQTITFSALPAKNYTDPAFTLSASSSSGLAVTYSSSNISVATVSGNKVTITGAGTTIITATQPGNENYEAAEDVPQELVVNSAPEGAFYWVGGSGNWSDYANHWATSSGGSAFHTQIPQSDDVVIFDAKSFTSTGQTVNMDVAASVGTMHWGGVTNTPRVTGSGALNIYGSLTLSPNMTWTNSYYGMVSFLSSAAGNTITMAGQKLYSTTTFNGSGEWIFQDKFRADIMQFNRGNINTNNQDVEMLNFQSYTGDVRSLTLGSSSIKLTNESQTYWAVNNPNNFTLNAGTSTITGASKGYYEGYFHGGGLSYYNVNLPSSVSVYGSNTFHNLTLGTGGIYKLANGNVQTITGDLTTTGTCTGFVSIQSTNAGQVATIRKISGQVAIDYVALKDISAIGGATFTATNVIDQGNNSGWTISPLTGKTLYWVGGSGNWSDGSHWASTSGGSAVNCTPNSLDNVYFDSNSFTTIGQTVTMDVAASVSSMHWGDVINSPKVAGNSALNIYGSLTLSANMTWTNSYYGMVSFLSSAAGNTITMAGQKLYSTTTFNGSGEWIFQDKFRADIMQFNRGNINTNNQDVEILNFQSYTSDVRLLTLGSSNIKLTNEYQTYWYIANANNFTFNAGTSTIVGSSKNYYDGYFYGGGLTYNNVSLPTSVNVFGNNNFNNLTLGAGGTYKLASGNVQTITGDLTTTGTCTGFVSIQSTNAGQVATIRKISGQVAIDYVALKDIAATGGAAFTATNVIDHGNNSGWIFSTPLTGRNLYWVGGTGNWSDGSHWASTSGGSAVNCTPNSLDNVYFDSNSFTSTGQTVTMDVAASVSSMHWGDVTNSPKVAGNSALNIYGSLTLSANMTWTNSYYGMVSFLSNAAGNTITMAGQKLYSTTTFNGSGEWIFQDKFRADIMQFNRGNINTNNQDVEILNFQSYTSDVRSLTLGSSNIKLTNEYQTYWYIANANNFTFNAGTSTIVGSSKNYYDGYFYGGGLTYNNVSLPTSVNVFGNNNFNNLTLGAGGIYKLASGSTQTITGDFIAGGKGGYPVELRSTTNGSFATISKASGSVCADYIRIADIKATGGASFVAGDNSQNISGNTGWIFSASTQDPTAQISVSPSSTIPYGTSTKFTASFTNGGTSQNYEWKVNGVTVQNGSDNTYTTTSLNDNDQIMCVFTSLYGTCSSKIVNSNTVSMTVTPAAQMQVLLTQTAATVPNVHPMLHTISYDSVYVGGNISKEFSIKNIGNDNLIINNVLISGADATEFQYHAASNVNIAAGASAVFNLTFTPVSIGEKSAVISFTTNDPNDNPYEFSLTGIAIGFPPPIVPASDITFSNVSTTSMQVNFASGDGEQRMAIMNIGVPPTLTPTDNTFYSGSLGNGEQVVYNGSDSTFTVTGMTPGTLYYFTIFEFNADSTYTRYLTDGAPIASQSTMATQIISFDSLPSKTYGDAPFDLTSTATSGLLVSYSSSDTLVARVTGSTVTVLKAGTVVITASQAGNENYAAATDVQQTLTINKAILTVTADNKTITYGDDLPAFTLLYSGFIPGDNETVIDTASIALLGKLDAYALKANVKPPQFNRAGNYRIDIIPGFDNNYEIVASYSKFEGYLTINKATLTAVADNKTRSVWEANPELTISYSGFKGTEDVSYLDSLPIATTIADSTSMAGNYPITLSDGLARNYEFVFVDGTLTVSKLEQTISFDALADKTFGNTNFDLTATASSGLAVMFTSSDPSVASVNGNTVTILSGGEVVIIASQTGDGFYLPAEVEQPLTINPTTQTITFDSLAVKTFGESSFDLMATTSSGLAVTYNSSDPSVVSINGSTVTILQAGTTVITASQSGNASYYAAAEISQTLMVNRANQVITFNDLPVKVLGDAPFDPAATASSGLSIKYHSSDTTVATASGGLLTILSAGTTVITASQPGNINYFAAIDVQQTLTVVKPSFVMSPKNGATDQSTELTVTAQTQIGATTYIVELSPFADFSSGVISKSGERSQNFSGLSYKTMYYARVKTDLSYNYGNVTSFTTLDPLSLTYVIDPKDQSKNARTTLTITANIVPGAKSYTIELDTLSEFGIHVVVANITSTSNSMTFTKLSNGRTYYAKVQTDVMPGQWGTTTSFTTERPSKNKNGRISGDLTSESEEDLVSEVQTYPNPFQGKLAVYVPAHKQEEIIVRLYDLNGKEAIHREGVTNSVIEFETAELSQGMYILRTATSEGVIVRKVIRE